MSDRRSHRGAHPADQELFGPTQVPNLRAAVADFSWLLSRGYSDKSALKLVGDRYALRQRQRIAVMRCACSDAARQHRLEHVLPGDGLDGRMLMIDGYNVLTTVEAALAGGVLLLGRDSCLRDMASMHGSFRKVQETVPATMILGEALAGWRAGRCVWLLDRPVSNSGRLKTLIARTARQHGWDWTVDIVPSPDRVLAQTDQVIASADSAVLDRCTRWFNLARRVVTAFVPDARILDLSTVVGSDDLAAGGAIDHAPGGQLCQE